DVPSGGHANPRACDTARPARAWHTSQLTFIRGRRHGHGVLWRSRVRPPITESATDHTGQLPPASSPGALQTIQRPLGNQAALRVLETEARGQPLCDGVRRQVEAGFGHSFANVRVHVDQEASLAAAARGAQAFTRAPDIYFAHGRYRPGS